MIKLSIGMPILSRQMLLTSFNLPRMFSSDHLEYYPPDHFKGRVKPFLHEKLTITKKPNEELSVYEEKVRICDTIIKRYEMKSDLWENAHETYYGKQRDMVNFPPSAINDSHPKVRMGFFPDAWFDSLYDRTGVTGPYVLFFGSTIFLLQKEIVVYNASFGIVPGIICVCYMIMRFLGPLVRPTVDRVTKKLDWFIDIRPRDIIKKLANKSIEVAKLEKDSADINIDLFQAAKENVSLQLENVYRKRNVEVHNAVKARLDYLKDKELTKQRFQRSYMINWIIDSVVKDFTPEQEKATLNQCITDLKTLAKNQKVVSV